MPRIKKNVNNENKCPNKLVVKKRIKPVFKFDMKKILKERQAEGEFWKRNAELDKEMKVVDELFQKEVTYTINQSDDDLALPKFGYVIFDPSKFNVNFEDNSAKIGSYSQQLLLMSIEENELEANIIFNNLMKSNWSPLFEVCLTILIVYIQYL